MFSTTAEMMQLRDTGNHSMAIIIPESNDGKKLGSYLETVFKSSCTNFGYIVWNDRSSDNSIAVSEAFVRKIIRLDRIEDAAYSLNKHSKVA